MQDARKYKAIVLGTSAGGLAALTQLLSPLPKDYPLPILIVQHRHKDQRTLLEEILQAKCRIQIKQADEKEQIENGIVYIAPPDYHLLVEKDHTFSLTYDAHVSHSRPSIDVLFETAAAVYKSALMGILLTGANKDGTAGMKAIKAAGGLTIAQAPLEAEYPYMPQAAIDAGHAARVLTLKDILQELMNIGQIQ